MKPTENYWQITWVQLKRNRLAIAGLWFVLILFFLATYAPYLALDIPFVVFTAGSLEFPFFAELFNRNFFTESIDVLFNLLSFFLLPGVVGFFIFKKYRKGFVLALLGLYVLVSIWCLGPGKVSRPYQDYLAQYYGKPEAVFPIHPFDFKLNETQDNTQPPLAQDSLYGRTFWLGSDNKQRDVLALLLYGSRISLTIGLVAVGIYIFIGVVLGALAGYFGGWVDNVISRIIEMVICMPTLIVIIALVAFIKERSIFHVMFIIGITGWTGVARLVRAEFLKMREQDFVLAARSLGARSKRVIFRHVLPNALGPVLVSAALGVPAAIVIESGLSFLGLGDVHSPSWGQILMAGRETGLPWLIHAPGLAIFLTVSAMNLLGDGLRDALDPKLRGQ